MNLNWLLINHNNIFNGQLKIIERLKFWTSNVDKTVLFGDEHLSIYYSIYVQPIEYSDGFTLSPQCLVGKS